jgi:ABC-type branched-subunit amino acid transport system permease subunit
MIPGNVFKDRNYSTQALSTVIIANYIVFALGVQMCSSCTGMHWFLWVIVAGLAAYNYFTFSRNRDEFAERKTQIIYVVSVLGLAIVYYLLGVAALHCNPVNTL